MTTEQIDLSAYLRPARAAARLGISEASLRIWAANGRIAALDTPHGRLYHPDEVDRAGRETPPRRHTRR